MGMEYEWTSEDKVIAVMGATGVGKSYFVQAATGDESAQVGHTLQSGQSQ
jgi:putative ribosome biogenesis GTPase RsgA